MILQKVVKVCTDGRVSIETVESTGYRILQNLIGGSIEHVLPRRLPRPYCMLVDEEGLIKGLPLNFFGSYLYETDIHGQPIVGDILLAKDVEVNLGGDIVGLTDEDITVLQRTFPNLAVV